MAQALSNLPVGAKVKFGKYSVNGEAAQDIVWVVIAKNHPSTPAYPSNSVTLLTERIVDLRAFDAKEKNTSTYGINGLARYETSNIRQWLNSDKSAGTWYVAKHDKDEPPTTEQVLNFTPYNDRPGFLNAFTTSEKNAILPTTVRYNNYISGAVDVIDKVYLLSAKEVTGLTLNGLDVEGTRFAYFETATQPATLTEQAFTHSLSTNKPSTISASHSWWTRTGFYNWDYSTDAVHVLSSPVNGTSHIKPCEGSIGVRPALNLSSTVSISDVTDVDGCYTTIFNSAPSTPSVLNVPTLYGGKSNPISWGKASDVDGDSLTYQLECSVNKGAYAQIYSGTSTTYAHLVPFGATTVQYRVKATDPSGTSSEYKNSNTANVINNNAPVISGSDTNLGVKSSGFTGTYTITDANNDSVTVTESIDGVQIRSLVATLGSTITYGVTEGTWLALSNGSHTLTIRATDGIDTAVRTIVFTKLVDGFTIRNTTPWEASTMPSRIMIVVTRNIPTTATFKVEVCNNGYDASPKWEDCSDAVKSGMVHVFTNKSKTASKWGVIVRVTVNRNGATGACYVSAIGGNFE